jgi:chromosome segregation ATPase
VQAKKMSKAERQAEHQRRMAGQSATKLAAQTAKVAKLQEAMVVTHEAAAATHEHMAETVAWAETLDEVRAETAEALVQSVVDLERLAEATAASLSAVQRQIGRLSNGLQRRPRPPAPPLDTIVAELQELRAEIAALTAQLAAAEAHAASIGPRAGDFDLLCELVNAAAEVVARREHSRSQVVGIVGSTVARFCSMLERDRDVVRTAITGFHRAVEVLEREDIAAAIGSAAPAPAPAAAPVAASPTPAESDADVAQVLDGWPEARS